MIFSLPFVRTSSHSSVNFALAWLNEMMSLDVIAMEVSLSFRISLFYVQNTVNQFPPRRQVFAPFYDQYAMRWPGFVTSSHILQLRKVADLGDPHCACPTRGLRDRALHEHRRSAASVSIFTRRKSTRLNSSHQKISYAV